MNHPAFMESRKTKTVSPIAEIERFDQHTIAVNNVSTG